MKKKYLIFLGLLAFSTAYGQSLNHTQGEILIQVSNRQALEKVIKQVSPLRRSISNNTVKDLTTENIWYTFSFDFTQYNEDEVLRKVRNNKNVIAAQFNHFVSLRQKSVNDPQFLNQWQWYNDGVTGKKKGIDVKANYAWFKSVGGKTKLGKEIVIAIIDDGTESSHPDLQDNVYINYNEIPNDSIDNDGNGYIDDYAGWNILSGNDQVNGGDHGVAVNGLVGAKGNNGIGVSGINWNIKLLNLKYDVRQGIKESDVISGYGYVLAQRKLYNASLGTRGAFIVATNGSWGIDNGMAADAPLWCAMYDSLGQAGILNVTAADNNPKHNVDSVGDLPSVCPSPYLIPVTSIGSDGNRYASYGIKNIDIAAPGENIYSTRINGRYGLESGTSFASPIVAGAIGLLYSNPCNSLDQLALNNPPAAALLVKNILLTSIDSLASLKVISSGGYLNILRALNALDKSCAACVSGASASRIYIDSLLIDGVRFRSKDNGGYGDFTNVDSLTSSIHLDGQVLLKIFPKSKDSLTQYYLRIWIDRNQDKDFDDTAELVWDSGPNRITGNIVSNIYLPKTKIDSFGKTLLRISLKAAVNIGDSLRPNPCDFYQAGEVEDYSINFLPKSYDCPDVLELVGSMISDESAKIFYQRIIPKLFYLIRYKEVTSQKWDTLPTRDSMVQLTGLTKCTDYIVESKTVCDSDSSKFKTMLKFKTTGCTVPVNDYNAIVSASAYPNPFQNTLNIRFNTKETIKNLNVLVVSVNGAILYNSTEGSVPAGQTDISLQIGGSLSSGIYFVQLNTEKGKLTKKVVKM